MHLQSARKSFQFGKSPLGIKEFTAEEFAARDIEAIKNPSPVVAVAGELPSARELKGGLINSACLNFFNAYQCSISGSV